VSSTVTVTVWATFQLAVVKVRLEADSVPSVVGTGEPDRHVGRRGGIEHHAELGRAARLGDREPADRRHGDAGGWFERHGADDPVCG
jgi:hypothetical protein